MKFERVVWPLVVGLATIAFAAGATAAEWDAGGGAKWDALLAAAKKESGLVGAICPALAQPLVQAFKADTGLDISLIPGGSPDISIVYRTQMLSGHVTIDVRTGGNNDVEFSKANELVDLSQNLFLPDVTNLDHWANHQLSWVDNARKYLALPAAYVSTRPMINKDIIDPSTLKNWTDLMRPEFKGKIAAFDPTVPGPGESFGAYLAKTHGMDFVKKLFADQQIVVSRDSHQLGEWAARGLYPIVLGMDPQYFDSFLKEGITSLSWVTPDDGAGSIVGGCSVVSIPKNAPHPNAALVFVNWYLSSRGQAVVQKAGHFASLRVDIPRDGVADYLTPDPTKTYINQYTEDWSVNELAQLFAQLKDGLRPIIGN